jgi:hypothetical protein
VRSFATASARPRRSKSASGRGTRRS